MCSSTQQSALAWIITGKYQYGMPLYRQAMLLRRFGGDISSNTLAASVVWVGQTTQPVINLMRDVLLESDLIYGNETTFQVLKEPGRRAQAELSVGTGQRLGTARAHVLILTGARCPTRAAALCRCEVRRGADDRLSFQGAIMDTVSLVGIDLGKHCFHLHAQDASGRMVLRKELTRVQMFTLLGNFH